MAEINFSEIIRNPHFSQFVALLSVPYRSTWWRKRHPEIPFWTHVKNITKLMKDGGLTQKSTRDQFISEFVTLITRLVEADPRLYYRIEDMDWFAEVLDGEYATVTMSMLFAMASSKVSYLTPVQVAELTDTDDSGWRNKAAAGEIVGAIKAGKQWLLPVTSLRAYGVIRGDISAPLTQEEPEEDEIEPEA